MSLGNHQQIPVPEPPIEWPDLPAMEPISIEMPAMPAFPEFPTYDPNAGEAQRRREEEVRNLRNLERRRKGYAAMLLTGGQGLDEPPDLNRPALLGR